MNNDEAIKILQHVFHYYDEHSQEITWNDLNEACRMAIEALKNERPKGKKEIKKPYGWQYCSECGRVVEPQDNFCWFCGADNREIDNE